MKWDLLEHSWEEISMVKKDKLVVFVPIAPIEEHGRHLPVGVDFYETEAWVQGALNKLDAGDDSYIYAVMPVVPIGFADMGSFPGNIHIGKQLLTDIVYQIIRAVAKWPASHIIVLSAHADPVHAVALEKACDLLNAECGTIAIAPMGAVFSSEQLRLPSFASDSIQKMNERFPGDFHAGWIETSCMMKIRPDLVQAHYRDRPDCPMSGREMMDGVAERIRGEGHIGYPRVAAETLGSDLYEEMTSQIQEAVVRFLKRNDFELYQHHPLFPVLQNI